MPGYRVVRPIGRGGMATVYLAIQESFQREVALKVMSPLLSQDESFSERFLREARIVSRLVHPHIVTVHDVGIQNGHHYLSMEYIEGQDLKDRLPSLNSEQLFRIVAEVARALDYAGRKGYVHRDVKPENIMIHNLDGRAVLMDFGIARAADSASTMTRTGTALGTPHYMSPEQARGEAIDSRSDLYSLGVLIYYMLAGRVPYEAESPVAVGIKHVSAPIPKLPDALSGYQYLIDKLMAKEPKDRYQTGNELVQALSLVDIGVLDQWRPTQGFEYLGSHEHTPLRSEQVRLVSGTNASADTEVLQRAAAVSKAPPSAGDGSAEESLHIPKEDLQRPQQANKQQWIFAVPIVAALIFAGYMYSNNDRRQTAAELTDKVPEVTTQNAPSKAVPTQNESETSLPTAGPKTPVSLTTESVTKAQLSVNSAQDVKQESLDVGASESKAAADESLATSSNDGQGEVNQSLDPVTQLLANAVILQAEIDRQPDKMPELLDQYRQVLALQPQELRASAALEELKQKSLSSVSAAITAGELIAARSRLEAALAWFPDLSAENNFLLLSQRLEQFESIEVLLTQAQNYLSRDRLIQPPEQNAKELFEQVLSLDSDNKPANKGLNDIAERYSQLAIKSMNKQQFDKAQSLVANGLSVRPDDIALLAIQDQLPLARKQEQTIQQLLLEANELSGRQQWFGVEPNAVEKYRAVLAIQPKRDAALTGLATIVGQTLANAVAAMEARDINGAVALTEAALSAFPNNSQLQDLKRQLGEMGPVISNLQLSGIAIADLDSPPNNKTRADRTLHIGFHYANFTQPATVLQAVLFDGARSVQIVSAPVVLIGQEGKMQFRFERPVEGFPGGGYHLDLLMASELIFSAAFVIDNK
nr:serine/threonine-protein kinase [Oceanicoccus sp. KOV_DT_Chl]